MLASTDSGLDDGEFLTNISAELRPVMPDLYSPSRNVQAIDFSPAVVSVIPRPSTPSTVPAAFIYTARAAGDQITRAVTSQPSPSL